MKGIAEYLYVDPVLEIAAHNEKFEQQKKIEEQIAKQKARTIGAFDSLIRKPTQPQRRKSRVSIPDKESASIFMTTINHLEKKREENSEGSKTNLKSQPLGGLTLDFLPKQNLDMANPMNLEQKLERRYYTELFRSPEECYELFKQIENDCLESIQQINAIDEDIQSREKASQTMFDHLNNEIRGLRNRLKELEDIKSEHERQLDIQSSNLRSKVKRQVQSTSELSESEKQELYSKLYNVGVEIGVIDKKERKVSEINYGVALDLLKDLSFLAEIFIENLHAYKMTDKKGFDRDSREYNSEKRDKQRYDENVNKEILRKVQLEMKAKKLAQIDRERGGRRKDQYRNFYAPDDSLNKDKAKEAEMEINRRDQEYFAKD